MNIFRQKYIPFFSRIRAEMSLPSASAYAKAYVRQHKGIRRLTQ